MWRLRRHSVAGHRRSSVPPATLPPVFACALVQLQIRIATGGINLEQQIRQCRHDRFEPSCRLKGLCLGQTQVGHIRSHPAIPKERPFLVKHRRGAEPQIGGAAIQMTRLVNYVTKRLASGDLARDRMKAGIVNVETAITRNLNRVRPRKKSGPTPNRSMLCEIKV